MPMTKSPNMSLRKSDRPGIFAMDVDHKELREFIYKVTKKLIDIKFDHEVVTQASLGSGGHGLVTEVSYQNVPKALKIPKDININTEKEFLREVLTAIHMNGHPACTKTSFCGMLW